MEEENKKEEEEEDPLEKVNGRVRIETEVCNQKKEGICQRMAQADMMTIVVRLNSENDDREFDLTPQIFIDTYSDNVDTEDFCTNPLKGLKRSCKYPFARLGRNIVEWIEKYYQSPPGERYSIDSIDTYVDVKMIKKQLIFNFGLDGYKYPFIGILIMGRLEDPFVAAFHADLRNPPFRHEHDEVVTGPKHAVLIVSVNTMSDDPAEHFCVIKNTYGTKWGADGYSRCSFEVFSEVIVPRQKTRDELNRVWKDEDPANAKSRGKRPKISG
ncbi:transducin/WD40 repeat-like superfamily protein [Tanacetum coccineum]